MRRTTTALTTALLAACSSEPPREFITDAGSDATAVDVTAVDAPAVDAPGVSDRPAPADLPPLLDNVRVYAHTSQTLYAVNPSDLTVRRVGDFGWPADLRSHEMTDIAVNADGWMWGITFNAIYRVNPVDARCVYIADFDGATFNGLSFIPGGELEPGEVLVAANRSGGYFRVDQRTGATRSLGQYGGGLGSSGDIVSVRGGGTFATVVQNEVEYLARLEPTTGAATILGPTGVARTWGLGYWRSQVYGFAESGGFYTIDLTTGRATLVENVGQPWWGAGVTTLAPTAPP